MEVLQVINVTWYLQRRQTSSLVKFRLWDNVTSAVTLQGQRAALGGVCAFKITPLTLLFPLFIVVDVWLEIVPIWIFWIWKLYIWSSDLQPPLHTCAPLIRNPATKFPPDWKFCIIAVVVFERAEPRGFFLFFLLVPCTWCRLLSVWAGELHLMGAGGRRWHVNSIMCEILYL